MLHIVVDHIDGHHAAHVAASRWVADHPCAAAGQKDRAMAMLLHVLHDHKHDIVTDVQAVGGWVKANIESDLFLSEQLADLICVGGLFNVATFCQHVVNVSFH